MATATVNFPPLRAEFPLVHEDRRIDPDVHRAILVLYNGHPLQTVDTTSGPASFAVPLAKSNQNVEITFVKTSSDAHTPTLTASGSDKINGAASVNMGTGQYSKLRLKSDGVSNWYVVG